MFGHMTVEPVRRALRIVAGPISHEGVSKTLLGQPSVLSERSRVPQPIRLVDPFRLHQRVAFGYLAPGADKKFTRLVGHAP